MQFDRRFLVASPTPLRTHTDYGVFMPVPEIEGDGVITHLLSLKVRRGPQPSLEWTADENNRHQIDLFGELLRIKLDIPNEYHRKTARDVAFCNFTIMATLIDDSSKNYALANFVLSDIMDGYKEYMLAHDASVRENISRSDALNTDIMPSLDNYNTEPADVAFTMVHRNEFWRRTLRIVSETAIPVCVVACGYIIGMSAISGVK